MGGRRARVRLVRVARARVARRCARASGRVLRMLLRGGARGLRLRRGARAVAARRYAARAVGRARHRRDGRRARAAVARRERRAFPVRRRRKRCAHCAFSGDAVAWLVRVRPPGRAAARTRAGRPVAAARASETPARQCEFRRARRGGGVARARHPGARLRVGAARCAAARGACIRRRGRARPAARAAARAHRRGARRRRASRDRRRARDRRAGRYRRRRPAHPARYRHEPSRRDSRCLDCDPARAAPSGARARAATRGRRR